MRIWLGKETYQAEGTKDGETGDALKAELQQG